MVGDRSFWLASSVTGLGDFLKFMAANFLTKVALIFCDSFEDINF